MSEGREEGGGEERREEGSEAEGKVRKVGKGRQEGRRRSLVLKLNGYEVYHCASCDDFIALTEDSHVNQLLLEGKHFICVCTCICVCM